MASARLMSRRTSVSRQYCLRWLYWQATYLPVVRRASIRSWRCDMNEVLRVVEKSEDYAPVERQ